MDNPANLVAKRQVIKKSSVTPHARSYYFDLQIIIIGDFIDRIDRMRRIIE
jgi:hypothetical protein